MEGQQTATPAFWHDADGTLHEWYQVSVFLGRQVMGHFLIDPGAYPELHYNRHSIAYFCQTCGDVWARLVFRNQREGSIMAFDEPRIVACLNHEDYWEIPGSLLGHGMEGLLPLLPEPLLLRELMIHCQYDQQWGD